MLAERHQQQYAQKLNAFRRKRDTSTCIHTTRWENNFFIYNLQMILFFAFFHSQAHAFFNRNQKQSDYALVWISIAKKKMQFVFNKSKWMKCASLFHYVYIDIIYIFKINISMHWLTDSSSSPFINCCDDGGINEHQTDIDNFEMECFNELRDDKCKYIASV